jgi:hypothetical protein
MGIFFPKHVVLLNIITYTKVALDCFQINNIYLTINSRITEGIFIMQISLTTNSCHIPIFVKTG